MRKDWHEVWFCKCGYCFGEGRHDRFMTFGFNKLCPECGEDVGLHGSYGQVNRETRRWVRKIPFNLFKFSTWNCGYNKEVK